jgi:hypothetical protein
MGVDMVSDTGAGVATHIDADIKAFCIEGLLKNTDTVAHDLKVLF